MCKQRAKFNTIELRGGRKEEAISMCKLCVVLLILIEMVVSRD